MNYDQVLKNIQTIAEIPLNQEDESFARVVPLMFNYAEGMIYRDLDFLATKGQINGVLEAGNREVVLPKRVLACNQLNVVHQAVRTFPVWSKLSVLTPTRKTLERVSLEAIDMFWPQAELRAGIPQKYAILGMDPEPSAPGVPPPVGFQLIRMMPTPDKDYPVEFIGVVRPLPLSPQNPVTFLSETYPELLCAACLIFVFGYQRDFGAQADDPAKAISWTSTYEKLKAGVMLEVGRSKGVVQSPTGGG